MMGMQEQEVWVTPDVTRVVPISGQRGTKEEKQA